MVVISWHRFEYMLTLLLEAANEPRSAQCSGWARAYRGGRLVCGCVHVAIRFDDRLGLTRRERRIVRVRFREPSTTNCVPS